MGGWGIQQLNVAFFFLVLLISVTRTEAQFWDAFSNPKVNVTLTHPPLLGLIVKKIAFGPATGSCSDQIVDNIITDFVSSNIEVIDRGNLKTILSEQSISLNGGVDITNAATIGKVSGASALIIVKVQRCQTEKTNTYGTETVYDAAYKANRNVTAYYSTTRAYLKGSIQVIDLAAGRIFASKTFDISPEVKNTSYQAYPVFPAEFDVQDRAYAELRRYVHRMFFPWSELKTLYFYDDKDFDMKSAYKALVAGNNKLTLDISKQGMEASRNDDKVKDKVLGHLNYNMGIAYMINNEPDSAIVYFNIAARLRPGDIVNAAIKECDNAVALKRSMEQVEAKASFEASKEKANEEKSAQAEASKTLTNDGIIEMVQLKLPESIIISKIKVSKCKFETTPDALGNLTKAGVSEKIITAMIEK